MANSPTIHVSPDIPLLMRTAAARILELSADAITRTGNFHVAISGGSTPRSLFSLLATDEFSPRFDWAHIHLWWSDERYLPVDSPESNYHMANEALIRHVRIPSANVHRVRVELPAKDAAADYETSIVYMVGAVRSINRPAFDLILLGLGEDGHTASIFPGTLSRFANDRWVIAHFVPQMNMDRITFTPHLINAARHVLFLVSGTSKAAILERVIHGAYQPDILPSQLIAPETGELTWMIDRDAADGNF